MRDAPPFETLLLELRSALSILRPTNPNRARIVEALHYAERSAGASLNTGERRALLRIAAERLRHADVANARAEENEVLEGTRRAMTAVLFQF